MYIWKGGGQGQENGDRGQEQESRDRGGIIYKEGVEGETGVMCHRIGGRM